MKFPAILNQPSPPRIPSIFPLQGATSLTLLRISSNFSTCEIDGCCPSHDGSIGWWLVYLPTTLPKNNRPFMYSKLNNRWRIPSLHIAWHIPDPKKTLAYMGICGRTCHLFFYLKENIPDQSHRNPMFFFENLKHLGSRQIAPIGLVPILFLHGVKPGSLNRWDR